MSKVEADRLINRAQLSFKNNCFEEALAFLVQAEKNYETAEAKRILSELKRLGYENSVDEEKKNEQVKQLESLKQSTNYYCLFNIGVDATDTQIKDSVKKLAKIFHSDKLVIGNKDVIQEIMKAKAVLLDPEERAKYNRRPSDFHGRLCFDKTPMVHEKGTETIHDLLNNKHRSSSSRQQDSSRKASYWHNPGQFYNAEHTEGDPFDLWRKCKSDAKEKQEEGDKKQRRQERFSEPRPAGKSQQNYGRSSSTKSRFTQQTTRPRTINADRQTQTDPSNDEQVKELQQIVQGKDEVINFLRYEHGRLGENLVQSQLTVKTQAAQIDSLEQQIADLQTTSETALAKLSQQVALLVTQKLKSEQESSAEAIKRTNKFKAQLASCDKLRNRLQTDMEKLDANKEKVVGENCQLLAKLTHLEEKVQTLSQENKNKDAAIRDLEAQNRKLDAELRLNLARSEVVLAAEKAQFESRWSTHLQENESTAQENNRMQAELQELKNHISKKRIEYEDMDKTISQLKSENVNLLDQVQHLNDERDKFKEIHFDSSDTNMEPIYATLTPITNTIPLASNSDPAPLPLPNRVTATTPPRSKSTQFSVKPPRKPAKDSDRSKTCHTCKTIFKSRQHANKCRMFHKHWREWLCQLCDHQSKTSYDFGQHMTKQHNMPKPNSKA